MINYAFNYGFSLLHKLAKLSKSDVDDKIVREVHQFFVKNPPLIMQAVNTATLFVKKGKDNEDFQKSLLDLVVGVIVTQPETTEQKN